MQIKSKPDFTKWGYDITCHKCKSVLSIDYNDLKHKMETKYSSSTNEFWTDCSSYKEDTFYVNCEICSSENKIILNHNDPVYYLLAQFVKNKNA